MTVWALGSVAFFVYLALVADLGRELAPGVKRRIWAGCGVGAAIAVASSRLQPDGVADVWVLPPAALLIGYWTSGLLFVRPMPAAERALTALDARLGVASLASATPRPLAELLEFAYSGVYPLIPIALFVALRSHVSADRFWTVVLFTDYVCFAMMACVQTRPPRAFDMSAPWRSRWRAVNQRLLAASSVQVNTFPSGHAAEALAVALLATGAPAVVVAAMFLTALAISAGAVLGRYHYAADALAGWAVALIVYCSFRL